MTRLRAFLSKKHISKAEVSRRTGISTSRLSDLKLSSSIKLKADELYLIGVVIDINPREILEAVCGHLTLQN